MSQERKSDRSVEQLTWLPEDSPANRSVLPDSNEARKMTVTSGRRCYESFGKSSLLGSLLKTYLVSSVLRSTMYLLHWKPKATKRLRLYFQLTLSAHRINENEFGLWATPNVSDGLNPNMKNDHDLKKGYLRSQVLLPTPDSSQRGAYKDQEKRKGHHFTLQDSIGSGKLNPEWVEWLMGLPQGWTDLECLETAKSFKQRDLLAKGL